MKNSSEKRKRSWRGPVLLLIAASYIAIFGEYHLSTLIWRHYCSDDSKVGMHIYEPVVLDESYFVPVPEDREALFRLNERLVYPDGTMLNSEKLSAKYDFSTYLQREEVSSIGPIFSSSTAVYRRSDGKLLARSLAYIQKPSWLSTFASADTKWVRFCPDLKDFRDPAGYSAIHGNLIREVFRKE